MARHRPGERVEATLSDLDGRGRGVGLFDGLRICVPRGLPGDHVLARLGRVRSRRGEAEAQLVALLEPGGDRTAAPCAHFGTCGGCLWQDVPYQRQVGVKEQMVRRQLDESGIRTPLSPPLPAPQVTHYRNKMEFSFGLSPEGAPVVGLHLAGRFDRIFDLDACHLPSPVTNAIVGIVRRFVAERGLSPYDLRRHEGLLRFLTIRQGTRTGQTMVSVTTSGEAFPSGSELAQRLRAAFSEVASVVQVINRERAQVATGSEERVLGGKGTITEEVCGFSFTISPSSFFQPNTDQAERLFTRVTDLAELGPDDRALDLYCGAGAISLCLSRHARVVLGVESSEAAVRDAARNSAQNGVANCQFVGGAAEDVVGHLARAGERFEAVVTDPPRVGMHPKALAGLGALAPSRIVYVSCNPEALGRDLAALSSHGYETVSAQLVDMLPHTPHCEVIAKLERRRSLVVRPTGG